MQLVTLFDLADEDFTPIAEMFLLLSLPTPFVLTLLAILTATLPLAARALLIGFFHSIKITVPSLNRARTKVYLLENSFHDVESNNDGI